MASDSFASQASSAAISFRSSMRQLFSSLCAFFFSLIDSRSFIDCFRISELLASRISSSFIFCCLIIWDFNSFFALFSAKIFLFSSYRIE